MLNAKPEWCNAEEKWKQCNICSIKDCTNCPNLLSFYGTEKFKEIQRVSYLYSQQFLSDYPESVVDINDLEYAFQAGAKYALEHLV